MEFVRPDSIEAAVAALQADGAACLAGGATLVAMMNADLVAPDRLVSLRDVAALRDAVRQPDGTVVIGAMRRHRETAEETDLRDGQRVLSEGRGANRQPAGPQHGHHWRFLRFRRSGGRLSTRAARCRCAVRADRRRGPPHRPGRRFLSRLVRKPH